MVALLTFPLVLPGWFCPLCPLLPAQSWTLMYLYIYIYIIYLLLTVCWDYSWLWCTGFLLRWLLVVEHRPWASVVGHVDSRGLGSCGSRALEHRLSSCALTQLLCGMWDLPRPGMEPVPPEVVGGVLTPEPPGKPPTRVLMPRKP